MDINSLPIETFIEILRRTDGIALGNCRRVCKKWKECIDGTDLLWLEFCQNEFKNSSRIARRKCGNECRWYHLYKNLRMWLDISKIEINVKDFYKFTLHDKNHALEVDYSVLPLKDSRGVLPYDMQSLKYIPVALAEINCVKMANNDIVTVLLLNGEIWVQRTSNDKSPMTEASFQAENFILNKDTLYFYNNRDVFMCDLRAVNLVSDLILKCRYDIKEIQNANSDVYIFTDCGKIVTVTKELNVSEKPITIPVEWIKQIRHIKAIDDRNFVCYSRNLFKIETNKYQHLYLDFPPITALFFYGDIVLIGTKNGEILLYRLSSQQRAIKPIFENVATLPEGKFPVNLDICERKTGPVIVVATFFEIMLIEMEFFPHEKETKHSFGTDKMLMYKRLLKIRDRLQNMS